MDAFYDDDELTPTGRPRRRAIEARIDARLATQADLVGYQQLREIGLDAPAIHRRVDSHALYLRTDRPKRKGASPSNQRTMLPANGVFSKHPGPLTIHQLRWRAVLAAPSGGRLGAISCCVAYDLVPQQGTRIWITYPGSGWRAPSGIRPVGTGHLPETDLALVQDVPGVTPSRAILDAAAFSTPDLLDELLDRAETLGLYDEATLQRLMRERSQWPGNRPLSEAIGRLDELTGEFRSKFERKVTRLVQGSRRIPAPVVNVLAEGYRPDLGWLGTRAIVECDGRDYHRSMAQRLADERREEILVARGFCFLRLRWHHVQYEPERTLDRIERFVLANSMPPDPSAPPARAVWW